MPSKQVIGNTVSRIFLITVFILCAGCNALPYQKNQDSAIETVLEWARLAPFPNSVRDLTVTSEGSMFTRAFRVRFSAQCKDVEIWLAQSPGTAEVEPKSLDDISYFYSITPGGGAQHAEVTISQLDGSTCSVEIYTYWS
jgi:hypothetical protein